MTDRDSESGPQRYGVLPSRRRHDRAEEDWVDPREVLDRLQVLDVYAWYESSGGGDEVLHLGPAAEDFHGVFEVGRDADHIPPGDADGVAMAAIQGLAMRLDERDERIERYTRRIQRQREIIEEQRADIETLREQLESLQSDISRLRLDAAERD